MHRCDVCEIDLPDDAGPRCVPDPVAPGESWRYGNAVCVARRREKWTPLSGDRWVGINRSPRRIGPREAAQRERVRALVIEMQRQGLGPVATRDELRRRGVRYLKGAPSYELVMKLREK